MTMRKNQQLVRRKLIEAALERRLVTYGEVGEWVGISPRTVGGLILDPINETEHQACRPLLSALVVNKAKGRPGKGFFDIAARLKRHDGLNDDAFWIREVNRIFDTFSPQ